MHLFWLTYDAHREAMFNALRMPRHDSKRPWICYSGLCRPQHPQGPCSASAPVPLAPLFCSDLKD